MTKSEAIQSFWASFGLPAYDETTVPNNAALPYLTYSLRDDNIDSPVSLSASIWMRDMSWTAIENKAAQIAEAIGYGHKTLKVTGGYIYLTRGRPFSQRMKDTSDATIRRIYINIQAEFLTAV